jgi:PLD-like domain
VIDSIKYFAVNVYEEWQLAIGSAKDRILVVTPYFGDALKELIESKLNPPNNFEPKNIKILTRFSHELAWGSTDQISVGIELIRMGVELKQLDNVHAKLLIADRTRLVLGSQNFTENGKIAKEASISILYNSEDKNDNKNYDDFLKSIDDWWVKATPVNAESLVKLSERLKNLKNSQELLNQYNQYRDDVSEAFNIFHCKEKENRAEIINEDRIWEGIENRIKVINDDPIWERIKGRIVIDKHRKNIEITSQHWIPENLSLYKFYPMFIKPINKLVYVRVCEKIISFTCSTVTRGLSKINGIWYYIIVNFSDNNINVNVKAEDYTKDYYFQFDGKYLILKNPCAINEFDEEKLKNIIFKIYAPKDFIKNFESSGDLFPGKVSFYQNLAITVRTADNLIFLECNY